MQSPGLLEIHVLVKRERQKSKKKGIINHTGKSATRPNKAGQGKREADKGGRHLLSYIVWSVKPPDKVKFEQRPEADKVGTRGVLQREKLGRMKARGCLLGLRRRKGLSWAGPWETNGRTGR